MVVPDVLLDAVKRLAQNLYINAPTLSQVSVSCIHTVGLLSLLLTDYVCYMHQTTLRYAQCPRWVCSLLELRAAVEFTTATATALTWPS
jgi:hypothetical protein